MSGGSSLGEGGSTAHASRMAESLDQVEDRTDEIEPAQPLQDSEAEAGAPDASCTRAAVDADLDALCTVTYNMANTLLPGARAGSRRRTSDDRRRTHINPPDVSEGPRECHALGEPGKNGGSWNFPAASFSG